MVKEHSRTLVFDLDDTISFTINRDWENAKPNVKLIEKSNELYNNGWKIIIATSRGSLSCSSRIEAEKKYRTQIETWLEKNHVLYDELSFEKKLGVFYIDDKSLKPSDFIKMTFRECTDGSWSDGKHIHIEDKHAFDTIKWYQKAEEIGFSVPKIYSVTGTNISREYFPEESKLYELIEYNNRKNRLFWLIGMVKDAFEKTFSTTLNRPDYAYTYSNYQKYIQKLINGFENSEKYEKILIDLDKFINFNNFEYNKLSTMMYHGNLTVYNVVYNFNNIYFINPNVENGYSNPVLDIATFCASLLYNALSNKKYTIDVSCFYKIKRDIYTSLCMKWIYEEIFDSLILAEFIKLYNNSSLTEQALLLV